MNFITERKLLVEHLKKTGVLKTKKVISAFMKIKRENFVSKELKQKAYYDTPLPILFGQTISQPTTIAIMTEELDVQKDDIVLEVGAGSGYQAAILSKLAKKVYSVERAIELCKIAVDNIKKEKIKNVEIILSDGTLGYKEKAPYDRIISTAYSTEIPPPLLSQLKPGGILIIPIGDYSGQNMIKVKKLKNGKIEKINLGRFAFVPLIGKYGADFR